MAEQSPFWSNVFGAGAGAVLGERASTKTLNRSIDRLERVVNRLADVLSRGGTGAQPTAGRPAGPTTQAAGRALGGGATFGGKPAASSTAFSGSHAKPQTQSSIWQDIKGAVITQPPTEPGGYRASGPTPTFSQALAQRGVTPARVAGGVALGTAAAVGTYTANHATNMIVGEQIARQWTNGGDVNDTYRNMFSGRYTAQNPQDMLQSGNYLGQRGGYGGSTKGYAQQQANLLSVTATNPAISNVQAVQFHEITSPATMNALRGQGLNPIDSQGQSDPTLLAKQIIERMGGLSRLKNAEQVAAAFEPSGSVRVTLDSYAANGLIPSALIPIVEGEIRNIMLAHLKGISAQEYKRLSVQAATSSFAGPGGAARKKLEAAGITSARGLIQQQRSAEGQRADINANVIDEFSAVASNLRQASAELADVAVALSGTAAGGGIFGGGPAALTSAPFGLGKLLSKAIPGNPFGGGHPTMSTQRTGMAPASQVGPGFGGTPPERQSAGGGTQALMTRGSGDSGVHLVAPRPGLGDMSGAQDYGARSTSIGGGSGFHTGVDLSGATGDPVKAAAGGTVVSAGFDGGWGNKMVVDHGGGWSTMYAHLSSITKGRGKKVNPGEVIGRVGDTGSWSEGSHLHFELWKNGSHVNPEPYLRGRALPGATGSGGNAGQQNNQGLFGWDGRDRYKGLGAVKPWVEAAAEILGAKFGIGTIGGYRSSSSTPNSDHPKGLALDFMCNKSQGDRLAAFAVAHKRELNITYVIWRQRIHGSSGGWKGMEDRGNPTANHMDHVHISFMAKPVNDLSSRGPGGGRQGGTNDGGTGSDNGSTGSYSNAASSSGGGAGGGLWGTFSETAALGLSGGGGAGGFSGASGSSESSSGSRGSRGGINDAGPSGPGDVKIGAYNVWKETGYGATREDIDRITGMVDVAGFSEARKKGPHVQRALGQEGWGWFQGKHKTDTGIGWDKDKYKVLQRGSRKIEGTLWSGQKMSNAVPYMLLQDKQTGAKFWIMSAHTQVHGYKGGAKGRVMNKQYDQIRNLYDELRKSGTPVFLVGDLNNPNPMSDGIAPKGANVHKKGHLDYLISSGANFVRGGGLAGTGFDHDRQGGVMNSDHPFVWGAYNIGSAGGQQNPGGGGPLPQGGGPAANIRLGKAMAARQGWTGSQWDALRQLWMRESGWRTNADNPTSSAYGIPQALTQLHGLGQAYMRNPQVQIAWGLNYIKDRYGNPNKAWDFWQKNHWYDQGAWNLKEDHDARVHKGEMIFPTKIADIIRDELTSPGIRNILGGSRGGSAGAQIIFQSGAIRIVVSDGSQVTPKMGQEAGKAFAKAFANDYRIKQLAEGNL